MQKILIMSMTAVLVLVLAAGVCVAETKIGYLDIQKALSQSESGKEAKELLSTTFKKYQGDINSKQEELKKLKEELEKQSTLLSENKRAEKEKEYATKLKNYQQFTKDAQEELQGKDKELSQKIYESFEKVVQEFGRKNGYTLILDRTQGVLYADDKADLTDELMKLFNATRKK